jgi:hypothetical protein
VSNSCREHRASDRLLQEGEKRTARPIERRARRFEAHPTPLVGGSDSPTSAEQSSTTSWRYHACSPGRRPKPASNFLGAARSSVRQSATFGGAAAFVRRGAGAALNLPAAPGFFDVAVLL